MKGFLRWISKIVGSTITIILVIILFPYLSKIAERFLPDESGAAIKTSAILATKLENSARLETMKVSEDGLINYDIRAAFVGTVASVNISYRYDASFGIDLKQVQMQLDGNEITFILPQPELIQDSLTADEVYQDDFWYKGFTLQDYEKLLEDERIKRRETYLNGEYSEDLWSATIASFEETIMQWLQAIDNGLSFSYIKAETLISE